MNVSPESLEAALAELSADDLEHLSCLLRERAAQKRSSPPVPQSPESVSVVVEPAVMWESICVDLVRDGLPWATVAASVANLSKEIDRLEDEVIVDLLAAARKTLLAEGRGP